MVAHKLDETEDEPFEIDYISPEEAREIFDAAARRSLNMSGEEFLRAWDAGEIEDPDRPEVIGVYMLMSLVR